MILICNLLIGLGNVLGMVLDFFILVFIIHALLSWFSPDPNNFLVRMLYELTEPILRPLRQKIPPFGMLDLSVLVAIFGLYLVDFVIADSLIDYGRSCKSNILPITAGIE